MKGWNGVKLIHSTPYAQLTDEDFNTMLQILRGMSLGLSGSTNAKGKRVAFSMAVKVNGVYCAEGILEKCSLERVVVDDWKSIYDNKKY